MKKLLALVIVLSLVLSMGIVASATPNGGGSSAYVDTEEIQVKKEVVLTNEDTVHPAEIFNFEIGAGVVEDGEAESAPAFDPNEFSISVLQGEIFGTDDIELPVFDEVGVYTYPITEIAGDTAGFVYNLGPNYLKITVINDGEGGFLRVLTLLDEEAEEKFDAFQNDFSAGSLVISKEITGNYALYDDEFDVTVTLTPPADKVIKEGPIEVLDAVNDVGSVTKNSDGTVTVTFKVTHESEVKIANIPYGVGYVVTEDAGDYDSNVPEGGFTGTIGAASHEIELVNELDTEINMGVNLDNLPYILILGAATLGLVGFTMRKRFNNR